MRHGFFPLRKASRIPERTRRFLYAHRCRRLLKMRARRPHSPVTMRVRCVWGSKSGRDARNPLMRCGRDGRTTLMRCGRDGRTTLMRCGRDGRNPRNRSCLAGRS